MVQNIGEYLAKRRQDLGLMQNEVGSYVGVSEGTVSRLENWICHAYRLLGYFCYHYVTIDYTFSVSNTY